MKKDLTNRVKCVILKVEGKIKKMKYYRLRFKDNTFKIVKGKNSLDVIKRYDLSTREHIETTIIELSGEQEAIAISNEKEDL